MYQKLFHWGNYLVQHSFDTTPIVKKSNRDTHLIVTQTTNHQKQQKTIESHKKNQKLTQIIKNKPRVVWGHIGSARKWLSMIRGEGGVSQKVIFNEQGDRGGPDPP